MKYNLFPIEIYQYQLTNSNLNSEILNLLQFEEFKDSGEHLPPEVRSYQTKGPLHQNKKYKSIFNWFNECLQDYAHQIELDCDSLIITNSWANKFPANTHSHLQPHVHRMSYISAVYYLTQGAPTSFDDPLLQRTNNSLEVHNNIPRTAYIEAVPGNLVLFPSWLQHQSMPHHAPFNRWTISFNTMPTGSINRNSNYSGEPSCKIKVE